MARTSSSSAKPQRRARLRASRRAARLDFAAIEIVGALLTPHVVGEITAERAGEQAADDYDVPPGLKLRDEISRYFRIGEALWGRFVNARSVNPASAERFMLDLLRQCFGFDTIAAVPPVVLGERVFPIGHAALDSRVPVVVAPAAEEGARRPGIDESLVQFADGARRRSATLLLQEYLNAQDGVLWGIAADGTTLRLMRDNASMTRPAWIEADLARIFGERLFADFSALWLLLHGSRFGAAGAPASDCPLERWRERGRVEGVTARDKLREGVEAALLDLGQGFIEHPANNALRRALSEGRLSSQAYFEELLRLVYRLIFLFAAEDRNLLHPPEADAAAKRAYAEGYGVGRLRERCMRRTAWDRNSDVWEGLKATFAALGRGEPRLGLPALGGLFARGQAPHLKESRIENRRMLSAIWRMAWMRPEGQPLTRVNWRDMETEELGSVYESLLELTPLPRVDTRTFVFAAGDETRGNARKTTGSYYTPDALVKLLLDGTLDPVLDAAEARNLADPAAEILRLTIVDPACGSGHFLLGAARRAAARIARLRSPGVPSQAEFQHALREVVSHSIHGVDRNPMAVELCKVALWIEALEPGKPLTFLDARIRCGDSLIGVFDYDMLRKGIPDAAYTPLTGDNKVVAKAYGKHNAVQREGKGATGFLTNLRPPTDLIDAFQRLMDMPEDTLDQVAAKQAAFIDLHHGRGWQGLKAACDLYVSAFVLPKVGEVPGPAELAHPTIPLTDHVWAAVRGTLPYGPLHARADETANRLFAFHWPLEFPHVFALGGFDVVVGNPPWERLKLNEQEFFAARSPEIAGAPNKAARAVLIDRLKKAEPGTPDAALHAEFEFAKRAAEASSVFARGSGRYPLTGVGDVNTYALFAEHFTRLTRDRGRAGVIVPTGIATDSTTSTFFGRLIRDARLVSLYDFQTGMGFFDRIGHARFKFCILSTTGVAQRISEAARFVFFIRQESELNQIERFFTLAPEQIARINPNTNTAPVFRTAMDAELTAKFYERAPVLIKERSREEGGDVNPWGVTFQTMFHMSGDSGLFRDVAQLTNEGWVRDGAEWVRGEGLSERLVPLYEAKMVHHFDHRWATYAAGGSADDDEGARDATLAEKQDPAFEPTPRYWVPEEEVTLRAARVPSGLKRAWREDSGDRCVKALAEWLVGWFDADEGRRMREDDLAGILGRDRPWRAILGRTPAKWLIEPKTLENGRDAQHCTPLTRDDVAFLADGPRDPLDIAAAIILRKQPRWLMGWRDITNATNERTVVGTVSPKLGVGNSLPIWYVDQKFSGRFAAVFVGIMSSIALDFAARFKIGGVHLNFFIAQQLPIVPPSEFTGDDLNFICSRVLELTYTSHSLRPWAEDLGHFGPPFGWDEERRALLRADLDAYFARKYGLCRDELRYILDPADVKGEDYPSETFRGLKTNELRRYGEYRTQRLVLAAFDRLTGA
ncbi:Eco57I restriction-modification methylase domain-containing protein [Azospirillum sp. ST 5-10]|uniref:Eco57I restriction-modification methylase domain-containing protein n=1 Tax=unclassified Azospirillum TaxID=2630922 RepID=UPI003F49F480